VTRLSIPGGSYFVESLTESLVTHARTSSRKSSNSGYDRGGRVGMPKLRIEERLRAARRGWIVGRHHRRRQPLPP